MQKNCSKCGEPMVLRKGGRWRCQPCANAYQRARYATEPELIRTRKRESMAKARTDPDKREAMNASRRGNATYLASGRAYNKQLKEVHFFRWRSRLLSRSGSTVTPQQLAALWKSQRGVCALSGRKLGRNAHVDHITPRSKGGQTVIENLRWLDPWVNVALQDLTDEEFVASCAQVAEWIGRRIMASSNPRVRDAERLRER